MSIITDSMDNELKRVFLTIFYHSNNHILFLNKRQAYRPLRSLVSPLHYLTNISGLGPEKFNQEWIIDSLRSNQFSIQFEDMKEETGVLSSYELNSIDSCGIQYVSLRYSPLFYSYVCHYSISLKLINQAIECLNLSDVISCSDKVL